MTKYIDIQHASLIKPPVSDAVLVKWAKLALNETCEDAEITVRLVDIDEIKSLNSAYRQQDKATNVLAFPADNPSFITKKVTFLGDVIICPAVLEQESLLQDKLLKAHWAHILIHGVLHLQGYDHINPFDEANMQKIEIKLLQTLGFADPYQERGE